MNPDELPPKMAAVVAKLNLPVLGYQPGGYLTHPCPHCGRKLMTNLRMLHKWQEAGRIPKCGGPKCERPRPARPKGQNRRPLRWYRIPQPKLTTTPEAKPCT